MCVCKRERGGGAMRDRETEEGGRERVRERERGIRDRERERVTEREGG